MQLFFILLLFVGFTEYNNDSIRNARENRRQNHREDDKSHLTKVEYPKEMPGFVVCTDNICYAEHQPVSKADKPQAKH